MENIPRDLSKKIAEIPAPQPARRTANWTVIRISDDGRVVRARWHRPVLWFFGVAACVLAAACAVLFHLYDEQRRKSAELTEKVVMLENRVEEQKGVQEVLVAKLALAREGVIIPPAAPEKAAAAEQAGNTEPEAPAGEPETGKAESPAAQAAEETYSEPEAPNTRAIFGIEDFTVARSQGQDGFRIQFVLRNMLESDEPISGYTFVIMKKDPELETTWVVLPSARLESGLPTPFKRGQSFSIARFKTVTFKAGSNKGPGVFRFATVLVFSDDGKLLLSEDLSVQES